MSAVDTALFKSDLVFLHFEAENQQDLFQKLSDQLLARGYVKLSWLDAITTREKTIRQGLPVRQFRLPFLIQSPSICSALISQ